MTDRQSAPTVVGFWFDPLCPWAWVTSRWALEVVQVRPIELRWHVMSLAVLNGGSDPSRKMSAGLEQAWGPVRVLAAAAGQHGSEVLGPLYTAMGERFHLRGQANEAGTLASALTDVGLPAELADAATDSSFDAAVVASHDKGMAPVGNDVGTPVLHVDGTAFFGPVVAQAPRGEAAGVLWDAVRVLAGTRGFFELKRTREGRPSFD